MFTDYLFQLVADNVTPDDFGEATPQEAVDYIRAGQPIEKDTPTTIIARHLFAKTLKDLLQDPTSDLYKKLKGQKLLRESLQDSYLHSIEQINKFFGRQRTIARMPGPFVVPNINAVAGKRLERIGRGTYGKVYKTSKNLAIKSLVDKYTEDLPQEVLRETAILRYLDHPNVINLIAMQLEPAMLAMPLATGGSLKDYKLPDNDHRKWVFYQLFRGLAYCHSKYVWHRDIKPENVLIFGVDFVIAKIADFGISIPYARRKQKSDLDVVTLWWRAPEILLGDSKYTETIDVWSLGVMLLDKILDRYSLSGDSELDQLNLIFNLLGTPTEDAWPRVTKLPHWRKNYPKYERTLETLTTFDPQELQVLQSALQWPPQRLSAINILKLPYFDSVRNRVETDIPARPITIESCGQVMLDDQKTFIMQKWLLYNIRQTLYVWLWQVKKEFRVSYQSLFYAYALFDLCIQYKEIPRDKLQLYACAAGKIASDIHEIYSPYIERWIYIADKSFSTSELVAAENTILTLVDFKLIFPTCNDFIYNYTEDIDVQKSDMQRIHYRALLLILNYDYAVQYTPAQIAQIAIEAAGFGTICLQGVTSLYDDKIKQYFANFKVPEELAEDHKVLFTQPSQ